MKNRKSRRIGPSSAYIGAGNITAFFSRTARKPYESLPEIYRQEASKIKGDKAKNAYQELNAEQRVLVRKSIVEKRKQDQKRKVLILITTAAVAIFLAVAGVLLFNFFLAGTF